MTDRETLEAVAKSYNEIAALQQAQRKTQAKMIRACVTQITNRNINERVKGIAALETLANMLDPR